MEVFVFILLGVLWDSCVCRLNSLNFEVYNYLVLQISFLPTFFSPSWDSYYVYVGMFEDVLNGFETAHFLTFISFCSSGWVIFIGLSSSLLTLPLLSWICCWACLVNSEFQLLHFSDMDFYFFFLDNFYVFIDILYLKSHCCHSFI